MISAVRPRALLLSAFALVGCPKNQGEGSPPVPSWDDGGGSQDGVLAAHDPDDTASDPASDTAPPSDTAATPEPTDPPATTTADTGETPPPTEADPPPETDPRPAAVELPKAHYTKIDASCGKDEGLGTKLKSFDLKGVDGKSSTNKSWRGRVMLVNFWGTWCKPCLKELPEFDQLYRRYRKHGLTLVAIATDEDPAPVKEFVDKRKLAAKVLIGAEDYAGQYGSPKFPFSFVVDEKGVIRASYRGYRPECMGKLEADVRKQLEARSAK